MIDGNETVAKVAVVAPKLPQVRMSNVVVMIAMLALGIGVAIYLNRRLSKNKVSLFSQVMGGLENMVLDTVKSVKGLFVKPPKPKIESTDIHPKYSPLKYARVIVPRSRHIPYQEKAIFHWQLPPNTPVSELNDARAQLGKGSPSKYLANRKGSDWELTAADIKKSDPDRSIKQLVIFGNTESNKPNDSLSGDEAFNQVSSEIKEQIDSYLVMSPKPKQQQRSIPQSDRRPRQRQRIAQSFSSPLAQRLATPQSDRHSSQRHRIAQSFNSHLAQRLATPQSDRHPSQTIHNHKVPHGPQAKTPIYSSPRSEDPRTLEKQALSNRLLRYGLSPVVYEATQKVTQNLAKQQNTKYDFDLYLGLLQRFNENGDDPAQAISYIIEIIKNVSVLDFCSKNICHATIAWNEIPKIYDRELIKFINNKYGMNTTNAMDNRFLEKINPEKWRTELLDILKHLRSIDLSQLEIFENDSSEESSFFDDESSIEQSFDDESFISVDSSDGESSLLADSSTIPLENAETTLCCLETDAYQNNFPEEALPIIRGVIRGIFLGNSSETADADKKAKLLQTTWEKIPQCYYEQLQVYWKNQGHEGLDHATDISFLTGADAEKRKALLAALESLEKNSIDE